MLALLALSNRAASAPRGREKEFFDTRVWPVLQKNCLLCHGGAKIRGGLEITSRAALLRGGEHGPAVVPGDPGRSLLLRAILYQGDIRMPPRGKLDRRTIDDLAEWIRRGAPWPTK